MTTRAQDREMKEYIQRNGLEHAPERWRHKVLMDWLKRKRSEPKLVKRATVANQPIPTQNFAAIPPGAKLPRLAIVGQLSGFMAAAIESTLEFNFSPTAIQAAARQVTDQFETSYGVKPTYADIVDAMPSARAKLKMTYFQADISRAETFLLDELRARLGVSGVQDSAVKGRGLNWAAIRRARKDYNRNRQSTGGAAALVNRLTPVKFGQDRKPVSEIVRRSVGLEAKSIIRLQPNPGEKPRFRPANSDKQPSYEVIEKPDGRMVYKMPDGTTFSTWAAAEQYIAATQNLEARPPARV